MREECKYCIYCRTDDETGEKYCKQTYTLVYEESSCDSFISIDEL